MAGQLKLISKLNSFGFKCHYLRTVSCPRVISPFNYTIGKTISYHQCAPKPISLSSHEVNKRQNKQTSIITRPQQQFSRNNQNYSVPIFCKNTFSMANIPDGLSKRALATSTDPTKDIKEVKDQQEGSSADANAPPEALSTKDKLKKAVKEYGSTVIVFHVIMSLTSLGISYALVSSGLDVAALLEKIGIGKAIFESKITQGASTFVIAYAFHKVFAPVRITITLTATPLIVRYLRGIGFLKKPPA